HARRGPIGPRLVSLKRAQELDEVFAVFPAGVRRRFFERGHASIVHVRRRERDIAQSRHANAVDDGAVGKLRAAMAATAFGDEDAQLARLEQRPDTLLGETVATTVPAETAVERDVQQRRRIAIDLL